MNQPFDPPNDNLAAASPTPRDRSDHLDRSGIDTDTEHNRVLPNGLPPDMDTADDRPPVAEAKGEIAPSATPPKDVPDNEERLTADSTTNRSEE